MSNLWKLTIAVMTAAMLSAAPATALASAAQPGLTPSAVNTSTQPGGTAALSQARASAVHDPCKVGGSLLRAPGVVGAQTTLKCTSTVTRITVEACLQQLRSGKWHYSCATAHRSSGRSLTVIRLVRCKDGNRNSFRASGHATYTYRGHTFHHSGVGGRKVFACGTL